MVSTGPRSTGSERGRPLRPELQKVTVPSAAPDASIVPSGPNATAVRSLANPDGTKPAGLRGRALYGADQILTVEPCTDASEVPSGLKAKPITIPPSLRPGAPVESMRSR